MRPTGLYTICTISADRTVRLAVASAVLVAALLIASLPAHAVSQRIKNACKNDYFRHGPAYAVGSPQLRTCMTKAGKRKHLSRRCLRALIDGGEVPRKYLTRSR